jgi:hypothetical protein
MGHLAPAPTGEVRDQVRLLRDPPKGSAWGFP